MRLSLPPLALRGVSGGAPAVASAAAASHAAHIVSSGQAARFVGGAMPGLRGVSAVASAPLAGFRAARASGGDAAASCLSGAGAFGRAIGVEARAARDAAARGGRAALRRAAAAAAAAAAERGGAGGV